jgi:hypothetical protein
MRIMTGIGTPISHSKQDRIVCPIKKHFPNAGISKEVPVSVEKWSDDQSVARGDTRVAIKSNSEKQRPRRPAAYGLSGTDLRSLACGNEQGGRRA